MLLYCLLASIISDEKSAIIHIFVSLFMMSHFSFTGFKIVFFSFGFQLFNYDVSRSGSLYHTWGLLKFLDLKINVYHQIWRMFSYYFFKYFFLTLSIFWYLYYLMLSHMSLRIFSFSSFFFSLFFILNISINLSASSFIYFSANSNLLLSPFREFFTLVIVLLNSRIPIWFFFYSFYFFIEIPYLLDIFIFILVI